MEEGHCPWLIASRKSAEQEYEALKALHPKVSVPLPIAHNRHAVVMSLVNGLNLTRYTFESPGEVLDEILENVRIAYGLGIIHSDLSEYNVLFEDGKCVLIDWPQWIGTDHPNAEEIIGRDIDNILAFFKRKYQLTRDREVALQCVTG